MTADRLSSPAVARGGPAGVADAASVVLDAAVRLLPVDGGAVLLMASDIRWITAGATDETIAALVDLEQILADGPSLDAYRTGDAVLVPDASAAAVRWPLLLPAVPRVRAYFSLPLQIGAVHLGVLDMYREDPGPLDGADLECALRLADFATATLVERHDVVALANPVSSPAFDEHARPEIDQATGILSSVLDVDIPTAYARLQAHAFATDLSLTEVATRTVSGTLRLDDQDGGSLNQDG